ncbi:delta(3:5)-Delta(2:4)-dienoyl-CoA isomerase-like isoform X3, partial [Leptotrombidium deliense]
MFEELTHCFSSLDRDKRIRAVVLSGTDKMFTGGLDSMSFQEKLVNIQSNDVARRAFELHDVIGFLQGTTQSVAKCRKPVISAIHSGCIGVGIDIISATDIRYCSQDAWFQIKEIEIGLAADLGTLQYFPLIVGNDSITRELTFTARKMDSSEAEKIGFVGKVFPDAESTKNAAIELAKTIATKSPIA